MLEEDTVSMQNEEPIRILQIVDAVGRSGGVMQVIYNWHKNIDKTKIQFDYLCFMNSKTPIQKEIANLGGNVYCIHWKGIFYVFPFIKKIFKFFKTHRYNILHSHITQMNFFYLPIAKLCGVKNIIQHSHAIKWSDKFLNGLRNRFLFFWIRPFITKKLACSDSAGKFLFKKGYTLINNGIDTDKFKFNQEVRNKTRKVLNIENKFVIGHIGRFSYDKNHEFLVDIFKEVDKQNNNSILLLIGDGPLKKKIEQKVNNLNLSNNVIFAGTKNNVNDYYQAMDIFVFQSLFEGLGIVAVEAQCSGLHCFVSDGVPNEAIICNTIKIPLSKSAKEWADIILEKTKNFERKDCFEFIKKAGFDIQETAKQIQNIYLDLIGL